MGMWYKLLEIALLCSILGVVVAMYMQNNKDGESFNLPGAGGAVQQAPHEWYYSGGGGGGHQSNTFNTIQSGGQAALDYSYFGDPVGNTIGLL